MPITVTLRGSNTDDIATASAISFYALGFSPDPMPIGEVKEFTGSSLRNRKGLRYKYSAKLHPGAIGDSASSNFFQDFGDLVAVKEFIELHRHLWVYSVTGSSRVDKDGDPFWDSHGLPVSVVFDGDAQIATSFSGSANLEFDLLATHARFS